MNKHIIILGMAILLLFEGLSGCIDTIDINGDTEGVKIINYSVTTEWYVPVSGIEQKIIEGETAKLLSQGYLDKIIINILSRFQKFSRSGFYLDYPEKACKQRYIIQGTITNIAGKKLNYVIIDAKFYDINGDYLSSKSKSIINLKNKYTYDFEISYHSHDKYFENVSYMELSISTS